MVKCKWKNEWTLAAVELTWHLYSVLFNISRTMPALCRCSKIIWSPWDALSVYPHAGWSTSSWWLCDSCFFEQFTRYLAEIFWKELIRDFGFPQQTKALCYFVSRAMKNKQPPKHYSQESYALSASCIWCRDCCKMMLELKELRNFVVFKVSPSQH